MGILVYAGIAADRNDRAMAGAAALGDLIALRDRSRAVRVGHPQPLLRGGWRQQLEYARSSLEQLAQSLEQILSLGGPAIVVAGRCAASIATLPRVARRHPDAALVWFDAHGDCNVPVDHETGDADYLGGMVISAAAGDWDSGLGSGLRWNNVILVGSRDLDPPERARIDCGQIAIVEIGPNIGDRLKAAIGDRPVYVHLDCDVLDIGLLATEYQVPDGMDWPALNEAFRVLAECRVVGLEIAECESTWPDGRPNNFEPLLAAIEPLLDAVMPASEPTAKSERDPFLRI